jgi:signal transduction histidine kinase
MINHLYPADEKAAVKLPQEEQYQQEISQLQAQNSALKSKLSQVEPQLGNAAAVMLSHAIIQEKVKELESRNQEMESLLARNRPYQEEVEQLRQELRTALEELARMPTTLSKSDQKMLEMQLSAMKHLDDLGEAEMVTSIGQELRQPLSSIIGYTDLLLGESVGLLGAMQRKFLERIRASSERLGTLMNELIQVLAIDGGQLDQTQSQVDLDAVVDDAVGNIIAQISEKNITMRVDLPEKLPEIQANREALQQILSNLLQNACLVTPVDGEISLSARWKAKRMNRITCLFQ